MVKPKETKENREKRLSCMWREQCIDIEEEDIHTYCTNCRNFLNRQDIYSRMFSEKNKNILRGYDIAYLPDTESDDVKIVNHYSKENEIKVRGIVYREFKNAPRKSVDFEYCADDWTEDDIWLAMVNEVLELIYGEGMDKWKPYPKETKFDRDNMKIEIVCSDGKTYVFELINR